MKRYQSILLMMSIVLYSSASNNQMKKISEVFKLLSMHDFMVEDFRLPRILIDNGKLSILSRVQQEQLLDKMIAQPPEYKPGELIEKVIKSLGKFVETSWSETLVTPYQLYDYSPDLFAYAVCNWHLLSWMDYTFVCQKMIDKIRTTWNQDCYLRLRSSLIESSSSKKKLIDIIFGDSRMSIPYDDSDLKLVLYRKDELFTQPNGLAYLFSCSIIDHYILSHNFIYDIFEKTHFMPIILHYLFLHQKQFGVRVNVDGCSNLKKYQRVLLSKYIGDPDYQAFIMKVIPPLCRWAFIGNVIRHHQHAIVFPCSRYDKKVSIYDSADQKEFVNESVNELLTGIDVAPEIKSDFCFFYQKNLNVEWVD